MIDPVSVAIALALLGAGWLAGRHARLKATPKPPVPVQPYCLCDHHYGAHDPDTGACNESEVHSFFSDKRGKYQEALDCACLRYTGPQPVEQYWVPPAADMSIITAPRAVEGDSR